MLAKQIPASFKPYLWSYDFEKLDIERNKETIILNILYYGNFSDWKKLFQIYSEKQIKQIYKTSKKDSWNKKSVNFWNLKLN